MDREELRDKVARVLSDERLEGASAVHDPARHIYFDPPVVEETDDGELEINEYAAFEEEVLAFASDKWDLSGREARRAAKWHLRKAIWSLHGDEDGLDSAEEAADQFIKALESPTDEYQVLVPIEGARPFSPSVEVGQCRIGILPDILGEDAHRAFVLSRPQDDAEVYALATVEAVSDDQAHDEARYQCNRSLDIVASASHRTRTGTVNPNALRVGTTTHLLDEKGAPVKWRRDRQWLWDHEIDPETLTDDPRMHFQQGARPWKQLPPDCELAHALREAYRRFGRARRLSHDLEASLPLAMSALEYLLLRDSENKRHAAAARLILASIASNRAIPWPLKAYEWYMLRNSVLHDLEPDRWTMRDAQSTFHNLYLMLDVIADLIVQNDLETREELISFIQSDEAIETAQNHIDQRIEELSERCKAAATEEYRERLGAAIELWNDVRSQL